MSNLKNELTGHEQDNIVNYIMVNLSKKGVKMAQFAQATGIDQSSLSNIKKEETRHLVSANMWIYLDEIYRHKSFEAVMGGGYSKYVPVKKWKSENIAKTSEVHSEAIEYPTLPSEAFAELKIKEAEMIGGISTIADDLEAMKIKKLPDIKEEKLALKNFPSASLPDSNPDITVGQAIDILIKAGASLKVKIEL
jgi:hypothetical protein